MRRADRLAGTALRMWRETVMQFDGQRTVRRSTLLVAAQTLDWTPLVGSAEDLAYLRQLRQGLLRCISNEHAVIGQRRLSALSELEPDSLMPARSELGTPVS